MSSIVDAGNLDKTNNLLASPSRAEPVAASNPCPSEKESQDTRPEAEDQSTREQLGDKQDDTSGYGAERARRRSERLLKKSISAATSPDSGGGWASSKMLSKIKSAEAVSSVARRTRASSFSNQLQKQQQQQQQQQHEQQSSQLGKPAASTSDTEDQMNDSNNNNLDSVDKQHQHASIEPGKKSQEELMKIVDNSRKRRLSKGSADSLSSYIRWSFSHIEQQQQQQRNDKCGNLQAKDYSQYNNNIHRHNQHQIHRDRRESFSAFTKQHTLVIENNNNNTNMKSLARAVTASSTDPIEPDSLMLDDEDDWSSLSHNNNNNNSSYQNNNNNNNNNNSHHHHLNHHNYGKLSAAEKLFRYAKLESGSSAANLAVLRHQQSHLAEAALDLQPRFKRQRTQMYSPEMAEGKQPFGALASQAPSASRKVSSYLGNVVDRLHQQNQQHRAPELEVDVGGEPAASGPCESHEADSQGPDSANPGLSYHLQKFLSQQTSLEDLCSSVGLDDSNQLVLAAAIHRALVDSVGPNGGTNSTAAAAATAADSKSIASSTGSGSSSAGSAAVGHNQQNSVGRRTYNTRGGAPNSAAASLYAAAAADRQSGGGGVTAANSTAATLGALNINSRAQQQRHAQAAAALSALASAGSQQHAHHNHLHQQQHHQLVSNSLNTLANVASSGRAQTGSSQATNATPAGGPNANAGGMVDFECDTCGSSFDDRHRLMQHQSIHLELKKNWFNETPVDEVMKIFNRRRGEFLCNTCNLRFEATFDYDKHNHQVHGQRPYCCQFCGNGTRTFRFWRQYLNHLYDHRYIFSCTIDDCDFTVNRRDSLRFHIFRFHLNCQLPQQQTHIRSAGHNNIMALNDSKWPVADDIDDDLDQNNDNDDDDEDDPMLSIGD